MKEFINERKTMGLAASQARLLTITARKSDCEFLSMTYSHQKIALARDMEAISDEYQAALNKTKLVYDYYGSGMSQMNLDYNLLMTPSLYNDYYPKLLTDRANRIILDSKYASVAKAAGIPAEGYQGTPSSVVRNRFIEALADSGTISGATAIAAKSVTYNNAVGLGGGISASISTKDITAEDLLELIKNKCQDTNDYGLQLRWDPENGDDEHSGDPYKYKVDAKNENAYPNVMLLSGDGDRGVKIYADTTGNTVITNLNLYDLLKEDATPYIYYSETDKEMNYPMGEAAFMQQLLVGTENTASFLNWMTDQFSSILGGISINDQALQYAYDQVYDLLYPNENVQTYIGEKCIRDNYGTKDHEKLQDYTDDNWDLKKYVEEIGTQVDGYTSKTSLVLDEADKYIGMVYSANYKRHRHGDGGTRKEVAVSLNNLAKVFLTAFKEYLEGLDVSSYSYDLGQTIDKKDGAIEASLYDINKHKDDIFTIVGTTDVNSASDSALAGFYDALFNLICTHGWTENDKITDSAYMQEVLKNGSVFISNINNDGEYYQGNYNVDTYIQEVTDTEGVAQAEAKYNAEKVKIEHKENRIDVKMKNLDAEISSLTTEYDSVKNVINKAIEKSFKRYDA